MATSRSARGIPLCAVVLVALCDAPAASAQVNVERLRMGLPRDGDAGSVEASFTGRTGSTEGITAGAMAQLQMVRGPRWFFAHASGDYTRWGGNTSINRNFVHLRYSHRVHPRVAPELFVQEQTDRVRLLRLREVFGAGPRFVVIGSDDFQLSAGSAWMLEHEVIRVEPGAPDDPVTLSQRWSNYVSAVWIEDAKLSFSNVLYVQPRWDRFSDFRILFDSSVVADLGKVLATRVGVSVRIDSAPPTGVPRLDTEVKSSLVVKF